MENGQLHIIYYFYLYRNTYNFLSVSDHKITIFQCGGREGEGGCQEGVWYQGREVAVPRHARRAAVHQEVARRGKTTFCTYQYHANTTATIKCLSSLVAGFYLLESPSPSG